MAPCSLNLDIRYRRVASFAALLQERSPFLTEQHAGGTHGGEAPAISDSYFGR
jgi:hypothetical protein